MRSLIPLALLMAAAGCDSGGDASSPDFGDPYRLLAQKDQTAVLDGARLLVPVQYSGGCAEHTFELRSDIDGDSATVWLRHDANGDACEALLTETVSTDLSMALTEATRLTLRAPASLGTDQEATVVLR